MLQSNDDNDLGVSTSFIVTGSQEPGDFYLTADPPVYETRETPGGPSVQLHWTPSDNAERYEVIRSGIKRYPLSGSFSATAFTDKRFDFVDPFGPVVGQTYQYQIIAYNEFGTTASNTVKVGPMPSAPAKPICLFRRKWTAIPAQTGHLIRRKLDGYSR